jgi:hypothetical protein
MAVSEKFQSVWRATARNAADAGGHNPLLAEAMIDSRMELHLRTGSDGKARPAAGRGSRMLTVRGKLLTMTARETADVGLAAGLAENFDQLGRKLGFTEWVECKGLARPLAEYQQTALVDLRKTITKLATEHQHCLKMAAENDPKRPKIPYRYYTHSGTFTPESRRRWQTKSRQCATWLVKAEDCLIKTIELVEGRKNLKSQVEFFRRMLDTVKKRRENVVRNIPNRGPDG